MNGNFSGGVFAQLQARLESSAALSRMNIAKVVGCFEKPGGESKIIDKSQLAICGKTICGEEKKAG